MIGETNLLFRIPHSPFRIPRGKAMRIKTQFVLNTLLFGIILVFMTVSAIITNQQVETTREQESIAANIAQGASDLSYLANDYLIYRESQQLSRWQSRFVSFSALTSSLNVARPDQQVLVRNIQTNQKRLKEVFDSTVSAAGGSSANQKIGLDPAEPTPKQSMQPFFRI